jgi:hypothetical protein
LAEEKRGLENHARRLFGCSWARSHHAIEARWSSVLMSISRSWTALGHQLESLAVIVKTEGKQAASIGSLFRRLCGLLFQRSPLFGCGLE